MGTATELRAQRNYAGHRLSPWLGHVMVSRQETARPLLTPGEVMQLPHSDELVLVSGQPPIRAKKLRYYVDRNFTKRVLAAPTLLDGQYRDRPPARPDDWTGLVRHTAPVLEDRANDLGPLFAEEGGLQQQRHPGLPEQSHAPEGDGAGAAGPDDLEPADDPASDSTGIRGLGAIGAAHAMNEGDGHRRANDDLLPDF